MFAYDHAVAERYPTIRAGVMHATGLTNSHQPDSQVSSSALSAANPATGPRSLPKGVASAGGFACD